MSIHKTLNILWYCKVDCRLITDNRVVHFHYSLCPLVMGLGLSICPSIYTYI
jgi:hypothetical protein